VLAAALWTLPATALDLTVPGEITLRETSPLAIHALATGPAVDGAVPLEAHEGPRTRLVWDIADAPSSAALLAQFRAQILAADFTVTFSCATRGCGGYDFRFGIDVAPAPAMFVDLSDFHYLTAVHATDDTVLSLVISRAGNGYMAQMDVIGGAAPPLPPAVTKSTRIDPSDIGTVLRSAGVAVLDDVVFDTGSASLAGTQVPSLDALATHLKAEPGDAVALVGHTDAEGGLEANVRLSQARAEAVRAYLITVLGVPQAQVDAQGIGFLAPRASNLTEDGRAQNRRVEVILTATGE
jgi:OOP family OmpA-OmpF porin